MGFASIVSRKISLFVTQREQIACWADELNFESIARALTSTHGRRAGCSTRSGPSSRGMRKRP